MAPVEGPEGDSAARRFTPALGFSVLTPAFDTTIALLTRERHWRAILCRRIALAPGERLVDIGCGTGSLAIRLSRQLPNAAIHGIDPDSAVLAIARKKALRQKAEISFHQGFLSESFLAEFGPFDVVTSSLVFHQVPLREKSNIIGLMRRGLRPGGRVVVADYGWQRTPAMRVLFRATVQTLDGVADTQPNADGVLPTLFRSAGFERVAETDVIQTATGSISIYSAAR
ncbi:MAG: methyltransferase domain-containing protein [Rhodospirillaceae bacterium]|nr:methyltransferase domain-containing protein [Rhodospirillaceae bacterium]